jgi:hypothetical protein
VSSEWSKINLPAGLRFSLTMWPIFAIVAAAFVWTDPNFDKPHFVHVTRSRTGSQGSETIMLMYRLPDIPSLRGPSQRHYDLAYRWLPEGAGEWVGYARMGKSHTIMPSEQFLQMMTMAGISVMPPVPERPVDRSPWWYLILSVTFLIPRRCRRTARGNCALNDPKLIKAGSRGQLSREPAFSTAPPAANR